MEALCGPVAAPRVSIGKKYFRFSKFPGEVPPEPVVFGVACDLAGVGDPERYIFTYIEIETSVDHQCIFSNRDAGNCLEKLRMPGRKSRRGKRSPIAWPAQCRTYGHNSRIQERGPRHVQSKCAERELVAVFEAAQSRPALRFR